MSRAESNGSFVIAKGGVQYIGTGPDDDNQIVTYNFEDGGLESTGLDKLFGGSCVSQYQSGAPSSRPRGGELEIGDFWTDTGSKFLHIWDGEQWVLVKTINGNPVGTIIQTFDTVSLLPPPGYLLCDGTLCPEEYGQLRAILFANTGDFFLPNLGPGSLIKF